MKTKNIQHSSKTKKFPIFGTFKTVSHKQKPENTIHNEEKKPINRNRLKNYTDDSQQNMNIETVITIFHMFKKVMKA